MALGRLAGAGRLLPNPHLLLTPCVLREAVSSARIEGTRTSLSEVLTAQAEGDARNEDVREVQDYVAALELGLERLTALPISKRLTAEIHARLPTWRSRQQHRVPGAARNGVDDEGQARDLERSVQEVHWTCCRAASRHDDVGIVAALDGRDVRVHGVGDSKHVQHVDPEPGQPPKKLRAEAVADPAVMGGATRKQLIAEDEDASAAAGPGPSCRNVRDRLHGARAGRSEPSRRHLPRGTYLLPRPARRTWPGEHQGRPLDDRARGSTAVLRSISHPYPEALPDATGWVSGALGGPVAPTGECDLRLLHPVAPPWCHAR